MTTHSNASPQETKRRGPGRPRHKERETTPEQALEMLERRREKARLFTAEYQARMRELTKLEQAAYKERLLLGEGFDPYTPGERKEAEALRAEIDRLETRARALNAQITHRLTREADLSHNESKKALLQSFQNMRALRIELEPF